MTRPTKPRNASSLVIVRGSSKSIQVLMGKRAPKNRFMPDIYVFPGGGVSNEDRFSKPTSLLRASQHQALSNTTREISPLTLATTAVRETFEETGLLLGQLHEGRIKPDLKHLQYIARAITPSYQRTRYHARFFLSRKNHFSGQVKGNGELLDLRWVSIKQALKLPIVDVTEFVLYEVQKILRGAKQIPPLIYYRNLKPRVRR